MIPPHVLLSKICIGEAELQESVKIVGDSPIEYLYDTIYTEPDMPLRLYCSNVKVSRVIQRIVKVSVERV